MSQPLAAFVDPLQYAFMRNALVELVLLGAASGLVGVFVVRRQLTFFAHALSHTIFPGVLIAALLRVDLTLGALVAAILTVALVAGLQRRADVGHAGAVGVIFITLFALGVVMIGLFRVQAPDVGASLVGDVIGVSTGDLILSAAVLLVLGLIVWLLYWPLVLSSFDRSAAAISLPLAALDVVLLGLVGGTAVVSVRVVGVILTVAMLVTPAATALQWTRRMRRAMLLTGTVCTLAGIAGLYTAYYVHVAPSSVMVLALTAAFAVSAAFGPRGLIARRMRSRRAIATSGREGEMPGMPHPEPSLRALQGELP